MLLLRYGVDTKPLHYKYSYITKFLPRGTTQEIKLVLIVRDYFEAIRRGAAIPGRKETFSYSHVQTHKRGLRRGQTFKEAQKENCEPVQKDSMSLSHVGHVCCKVQEQW